MNSESENNDQTLKLPATFAVISASFFWGFGHVCAKFAIAEIHPFAFMMARVVFSAAALFLVFRVSGVRVRMVIQYWKEALPLAFFGVAANQLLFIYGLDNSTPSHSALIYTLLPIFAALLARFILKEGLTLVQLFGICLAFAGAVVLATGGTLSLECDHLYGDIVLLCGAFSFALYTVIAKPFIARVGVRRSLLLIYLLAVPMMIPFGIAPSLEQNWQGVGSSGWIGLGYMVLFSTVVAYLCYNFAIKQLPSSIVAAFMYLQPVFGTVSSVLILGETLKSSFFIAAAFIFAGLIIARERGRGLVA